MKHLYANKIDIHNFRAFGPNFSLSIPAEPGLIIVYGMNGLGKTTFFEAIEWLLTGDVRRISEVKEPRTQLAKHLTRRDAEPNSHFVAATFGPDERRISRSEAEHPTASELIDLLVSADWTPVPDDISTYLRLTTFLPQARKLRFEEEKPKEQWQLLRGPAGVDQLDVMRRALGGVPTKNAFDKVAEELRTKALFQKQALDDWKKLLAERALLTNRVTDAQIVSPEQAESFLSELRDQLVSLDIQVLMEPEMVQGWTLERRLSMIVKILDATADEKNNELSSIGNFSELIKEWIAITSELEGDLLKLETFTKQAHETGKLVEIVESTVVKLRLPVFESERVVAELRRQREAAIAVAEALARLAGNYATHEKLLHEQTDLRTSAEKMRDASAELSRADQHRKTLSEKLGRLGIEQEALIALRTRVVDFDSTSEQAKAIDAELDKLQSEKKNSFNLLEESESLIAQYKQKGERLTQQKRDELVDTEAMTRAIKLVCDHMEQDAKTCPVCQAIYEDGSLLKRAERSVAATGVDTTAIDLAIDMNKSFLAETQEKLSALQQRINQLPPLINELARQQSTRNQEFIYLKQELAKRGYDWATARDQIGSIGETMAHEIEETRDKLTKLPSVESVRQQTEQTQSELFILEGNVAKNKEISVQLKSKIEQDEVIVQSFRSQKNGWNGDQAGISRIIDLLKSKETESVIQYDLSKQALDQAKSELDELSKKLRGHATDLKTHEAFLTAKQQRQNALRERWGKILEGPPDATSLQHAIHECEVFIETVGSIRRQCSQVAERLNAWRTNNQSATLESSIVKKLQENDNCTEVELTAKLEEVIFDTESEIARVEEVKERALKLANELQEKADHFNDRALRPLAARIQRFHNVLSPFRYHIDLEAKRRHGAMELRQFVGNENGSSASTSNPQIDLSDGQMAVQGLATLFAASTEYKWCRWPALLLDDPLQSSDLLHTSAFIDILRGLISNMGYQVFLSSHDMEEAKYIIRKCERSGIRVTKCHLLGPRSNGVEVVTS